VPVFSKRTPGVSSEIARHDAIGEKDSITFAFGFESFINDTSKLKSRMPTFGCLHAQEIAEEVRVARRLPQ
jgi:hypothetical protein